MIIEIILFLILVVIWFMGHCENTEEFDKIQKKWEKENPLTNEQIKEWEDEGKIFK